MMYCAEYNIYIINIKYCAEYNNIYIINMKYCEEYENEEIDS